MSTCTQQHPVSHGFKDVTAFCALYGVLQVDGDMNAGDAAAVKQLLAAVAAGPGGQPPPQQPNYSRAPSSLYSNVNSYSPSIADSTAGANFSARGISEQPGSPSSAWPGGLKKPSTFSEEGKQQQGIVKHAVMWNDQTDSISGAGISSASVGAGGGASIVGTAGVDNAAAESMTGTGAQPQRTSTDDSVVGNRHGAARSRPALKQQGSAAAVAGSVTWSSDGGGFTCSSGGGSVMRRSADGSLQSSSGDGARHSSDGGHRASVHFVDEAPAAHEEQAKDSGSCCLGQGRAVSATIAAAVPCSKLAGQGQQQHLTGSLSPRATVTASVTAAATPAVVATELLNVPAAAASPKIICDGTGEHIPPASTVEKSAAHAVDGQSAASPQAAVATTSTCMVSVHGSDTNSTHLHHSAAQDFRLAAVSVMSAGSAAWQLSSWDEVPLMDIPRIIKALAASPPPPPQPMVAMAPGALGSQQQDTSATRRPKTKARFKRVIQQTQQALALLEKMQHAQAAAGDVAVTCNASSGTIAEDQ